MPKKNLAYINKEMLLWARSETPFSSSPELLSERFPRFSTEKLKKWESGEDLPSIREAKDLASIYKLPFACFYLSAPPEKKPKRYTDRRTNLGTKYGEMSYELWAEINRISNDRDTLLELIQKDAPTNVLPIINTSDDVEKVSTIIQDYFCLPKSFKYKKEYDGNSFNYFRELIERKGILVAQISSVSLSEIKALSIYEDQYPIIAINSKDYERAKTFSLFHEVAHLFRRSSSLCLLDDDERDNTEEKICDQIAAEVLMDREEFIRVASEVFYKDGEWSIASLTCLADRFGVSIVSAFRKLHDVSIITDDQYENMYREIKNAFDEKINAIEAARKERELRIPYHIKFINSHGTLWTKTVVATENIGRISLGEACEIMSIKRKHYNSIVRAVML